MNERIEIGRAPLFPAKFRAYLVHAASERIANCACDPGHDTEAEAEACGARLVADGTWTLGDDERAERAKAAQLHNDLAILLGEIEALELCPERQVLVCTGRVIAAADVLKDGMAK